MLWQYSCNLHLVQEKFSVWIKAVPKVDPKSKFLPWMGSKNGWALPNWNRHFWLIQTLNFWYTWFIVLGFMKSSTSEPGLLRSLSLSSHIFLGEETGWVSMFVRTCNMQTSWISAVYRHRSITAFHSLIPDITLCKWPIFLLSTGWQIYKLKYKCNEQLVYGLSVSTGYI